MKLAAFACAALLALVTVANAYEHCTSHCAEGYTWSPESGTCVPQTPST